MFQRQNRRSCLRLHEHCFRFFHHDLAASNNLELATLAERESRDFFSLPEWSSVRSTRPSLPLGYWHFIHSFLEHTS